MNTSNLTITLQNRKAFKKILDSLNVEQINKIPTGFNNNVLWNVGHIIAVQQRLIYGLAGQKYFLDKVFVNSFLPGTKPDEYYNEAMINDIKLWLVVTYDQMIMDINDNKFLTYTPFTTALRYEINDLDSAIAFNLYHEALHMGHILNIKKHLY
ncbi:MAG: DinB family protein [Saprospiraceae bacterium]|nr:DinB family protein [Saprospiraceae bacterium]